MNTVYFGASCVTLTIVAYVTSRLKRDPFRLDTLAGFAVPAGFVIAIFGSRIPLVACIVLACVAICAATDASSGYVYNSVTYPSLIATLGVSAATGALHAAVFWAAGTFAAGLILYAASGGRGLGLGDVKLFTLVAAGLCSSIGEIVAASFVLGALAAGIALIRRRLSFGETIAFAPYIALATFATVPAQGLLQ